MKTDIFYNLRYTTQKYDCLHKQTFYAKFILPLNILKGVLSYFNYFLEMYVLRLKLQSYILKYLLHKGRRSN